MINKKCLGCFAFFLIVGQPVSIEACDKFCHKWKTTVVPHSPNYTQPIPYRRCFEAAAKRFLVPEAVLVSVAAGESDFRSKAISASNAIGVMQIKWPITARHLGVDDQATLFHPCSNIFLGAKYLRELLVLFENNIHRALGAYYWGPSRVSIVAPMAEEAIGYSIYIYEHYLQLVDQRIPADTNGKAAVIYQSGKSNWGHGLEGEKNRLAAQKKELVKFYRGVKRDFRARAASLSKEYSG